MMSHFFTVFYMRASLSYDDDDDEDGDVADDDGDDDDDDAQPVRCSKPSYKAGSVWKYKTTNLPPAELPPNSAWLRLLCGMII